MSKPTISACVIMHDDYDALKEALLSIIDVVDEIVVVDGAYEWIAPFLDALGRDPSHSAPEAIEIITSVGAKRKVRYFPGVWRDEVHKRIFAYEACLGDFIYLIDSDEIHEFDYDAFTSFAQSDKLVASAASPLFADGSHISFAPGSASSPLKPVMFRRSGIDAWAHLAYLWLVLGPEEKAKIPASDSSYIYTLSPIALNHHLSNLRSLRTSFNRSAFYNFLSIRTHGKIGWWGIEEIPPLRAIDTILDRLSIFEFYEVLRGDQISTGFDPTKSWSFAAFDQSFEAGALIRSVALRQRSGFANEADALASAGRTLVPGQSSYIDVTDWGEADCALEVHGPVHTIRVGQYDMLVGDNGLVASEKVTVQSPVHKWSIGKIPSSFRTIIGVHAWWPNGWGYKSRLIASKI